MNRWVNFLSLLPGTLLTILIISIAFLRFYDETDFTVLGYVANTRTWSNRLTVAAILVALVGFCVEWDRRNREAARIANERRGKRRREEEERRRESSSIAARADERMSELRKQNERLAELESKIDGSFFKHGIYSTPVPKSKQP
jgi:type VI protein secretion system component VasK